ncbi:MAG: cysteine desulfurase family protein [Bdellovibrionales bacterium]
MNSGIQHRIYLDNNATAPLSPLVVAQLPVWAEHFGNPSSIHWGGRGPKTHLRDARKSLSELIGCDPLETIFTSGGSEANNLVLKGLFFHHQRQASPRRHYLLSSVEHPSLLEAARFIETLGAEVEIFPITPGGILDLEDFKSRVREDTALVSCMLANNETGTIFPIKKMARIAHEKGALFHTDAVQALGKMFLSVRDLDVDIASFAGHKFYSLKGTGVLYSKRGHYLEPLIHGGGQERHRRAGTENIMAIAAFGLMADQKKYLEEKIAYMTKLRNRFESELCKRISGVSITAGEAPRLGNTSSVVIDGVEGETLLMRLDMEGVAVSTGSACSAGSPEPSAVLLNMGLTRRQAQSSLRVSFGWYNTENEVERFIDILERTILRIRDLSARERQAIEEAI